jgi:hypothetical protein
MTLRKFNWPVWVAFLLCIIGLVSYPFLLVNWSFTRDFGWPSLLLFGIAAVLLFIGIRRAFAPDRTHPTRSRIAAAVATLFSVMAIGIFVFAFFIAARWIPASVNAPHIGQKAPDFTLPDTNGRMVSLAELLSTPISGKVAPVKPKGVLLIFYRGYW